jgi:hypothetical protein
VALGRTPLVELGTPWCQRCQAFDQSLADARMRDAIRGAYLIRINIDEWDDASLHLLGFPSDSAIFILFPVDSQGRPVGPTLTTRAWETDRPESIAPPLQRFVQAQKRRITTPTASPTPVQGGPDAVPVVALIKQVIFVNAVRAQVAKAAALGLTPFIELGDPGCGPCREFDELITNVIAGKGTPNETDAFANTYAIRIVQEWEESQFDAIGMVPHNAIPTFFSLDGTGRVTGHVSGLPDTDEEWRQFKHFLQKVTTDESHHQHS